MVNSVSNVSHKSNAVSGYLRAVQTRFKNIDFSVFKSKKPEKLQF